MIGVKEFHGSPDVRDFYEWLVEIVPERDAEASL